MCKEILRSSLNKSTENLHSKGLLLCLWTAVEKLSRFFSSIWFEHVSRVYNKHADALAPLWIRKFMPWRGSWRENYEEDIKSHCNRSHFHWFILWAILAKFHYSKFELAIFVCGYKRIERLYYCYWRTYYRGSGRVLTRALFLIEAKEELCWIHVLSCGENDNSFYRRL